MVISIYRKYLRPQGCYHKLSIVSRIALTNPWSVPQQPPIKPAPACINAGMYCTNSRAVVRKTVLSSTISGSPALGYIQMGRSVACRRREQIGRNASMPCPQFAPMPSIPILINSSKTCSGEFPIMVRSLFSPESYTMLTMTGSPVCLAAVAAILASTTSIIVSTIIP